MDKLKQTFSRSKDKDGQEISETTGSSTKASGQGSHFGSSKVGATGDSIGSTVTSQQDAGIGGTPADPTAARTTAGPESSGTGHIGTVQPSSDSPAVGQTSTYSTHRLGQGDPVSSVVDSQSNDPTTFQRPEAGVSTSSAGVPPNAAQTAAARAFKGEGMPGAYPSSSYENPYKAENLDPRVDGLPLRSKEDRSSGAGTTTAAGVGAGAAGAAASKAVAHDTDRTTAAPSTLTSTANPADRSAEYSRSEQTKVPEAGATAATGSTEQESGGQTSLVGKALAAVGLGGAAGAAGYGLANKGNQDSAVADSTLPAGSTPQPTHGRKESIPTTAYPAGIDSPRAINPPVGGTHEAAGASAGAEGDSRHGRDAAIGAAGVGTAGAAAYGASQLAGRDQSSGASAAPVSNTTPMHHATTTPATETTLRQDNTSKLREDLANQPSGISDDARARATDPEKDSSGIGKPAAAAAGVGAAAAGAGYLASRDTKESGVDPATSGRTGERLKEPVTTSPTASNEPWSSKAPEHSKSTAAEAGGLGAGAGAAGAYAATRNDQNDAFGHTAIYGPDTTAGQKGMTSTATNPPTTTSQTSEPGVAGVSQADKDDRTASGDHDKRNAALAGAAGVGAVGAGAYAAYEISDKHAAEEAARQKAAAEKERKAAEAARAENDKAQRKEAEKQEKAAAKEEKKHQKEVEKQEKAHEKEVAAMEKQRTKEEEKHQKELEKQRTEDEEQRRRTEQEEEERRKKTAAAAAVGGAGAAGAGAYALDKNKESSTPASPASKTEEKEKKPGLFKRIFKRRKNKDTGESEDYSSDEDQKDSSHRGAYAGAAAGTAAVGGAAAYGAHTADNRNIGTAHTTEGDVSEPVTKYESASGGAVKPSYNPFTKDDPSKTTTTTNEPSSLATTAAGKHDQSTTRDAEPTTASTTTPGAPADPPRQISTSDPRPIEPTLGLPYDPSKDPDAAQRIKEHDFRADAIAPEHERADAGIAAAAAGATTAGATTGKTTTTGATDITNPTAQTATRRDSATSTGSASKGGIGSKLKGAIMGYSMADQDEHAQYAERHAQLDKDIEPTTTSASTGPGTTTAGAGAGTAAGTFGSSQVARDSSNIGGSNIGTAGTTTTTTTQQQHGDPATPDSTRRRSSVASTGSANGGSGSAKKGFRQKLKEAVTGYKLGDQDEHAKTAERRASIGQQDPEGMAPGSGVGASGVRGSSEGGRNVLHKKEHQIPDEVKGRE